VLVNTAASEDGGGGGGSGSLLISAIVAVIAVGALVVGVFVIRKNRQAGKCHHVSCTDKAVRDMKYCGAHLCPRCKTPSQNTNKKSCTACARGSKSARQKGVANVDSGVNKLNPMFNLQSSQTLSLGSGPGESHTSTPADGYMEVNIEDGNDTFGFGMPDDDTRVTAAMHSAKVVRRNSSIGADTDRLPKAWQSLPTGFFKQEGDWPTVLLSYQSDSTGEKGSGVGKGWMWAMANRLKAAKITSFNGYQVGPGHPSRSSLTSLFP
jgi:hypothetical protein